MGVVERLEGIVRNSDEKRGIGRANVCLFKEISEGGGGGGGVSDGVSGADECV